MPIKPNVKQVEKKQFFHRDGVLAIMAFGGAGILQYMAGKGGPFATIYEPVSYVLGFIGLIILYGMLATGSKKKHRM